MLNILPLNIYITNVRDMLFIYVGYIAYIYIVLA